MISKKKKRITVSLNNDQVDALEKLSGNTGLTKSEILILAISALISWDIGKGIGNAITNKLDELIAKK